MTTIKFECYNSSPLSLVTTMLHAIPSAMSLEQVQEQYSLSFDAFESFGEKAFFVVLTPRTDLEDEDSPMVGKGWDNFIGQYQSWLDWVNEPC